MSIKTTEHMCHIESDLLTNTCFGTVKLQQPEKMGNQTSFQHSNQPNTRATHHRDFSFFEANFCPANSTTRKN